MLVITLQSGLEREAAIVEGLIVSDTPLGAGMSLIRENDAMNIPVTMMIGIHLKGILCVIHRATPLPVLIARSTSPTCSRAAAMFQNTG